MTLPLWMVLAFAAWTLAVLLAGVGVRRWALILSHRASLTSFPADTAHGSPAYRRAMRAHANCVENLPVFAAIVLTASLAKLTTPLFGTLCVTTMIGRIGQSLVHMLLPESNASIAVRFTFFLLQIAAMVAMMAVVVAAAAL